MRAIVLEQFGDATNLKLGEWPKAEPQAEDVCIQVRAVSFNPVDYKLRQGRFGGSLPMVLGYDAAGVIESVGCNVKDLSVGDEVYAYLGGPKSNGAYAEYVCVPRAFVAPKPTNLDFLRAAAVPLVGLTAYQAVMDPETLRAGPAVFVAGGSGGVGSAAIQLLRKLGADPILTTAGSDQSAAYLTAKLGIREEHILRYRGLSIKQMIDRTLTMNNGRPVAAAFDFWGGEMKHLCCNVIDFEGRVVSIVEEPAGFELNVWNARRSPMFTRSASLHFAFLGARAMFGSPETWDIYRTQLEELATLIETGYFDPPEPTVVGDFSAESVQSAHRSLEAGHVHGKLVMPVG